MTLGLVLSSLAVLVSPSVSQAKTTRPIRYYVELGDSWAVGTDATAPGAGPTTEAAPILAAKKMHMQLENFGCSGATTTSLLDSGCAPQYQAVGGPSYGALTQAGAAEAFIAAHPGQIGAIVVSIGGNDVDPCATASDQVGCITSTATGIQTRVTQLAGDLRTAAGAGVPIIGLSYFDPLLSYWVYPPVNQSLAQLSVLAFSTFINPALQAGYTSAGGVFVDVTAATGIYLPFTRLKNVAPFGKLPYPVAQVCKLTWGCSSGDGHPNLKGQQTLAKLTVNEWKTLPHP